MNLRHLRFFVAVVESKGVTKAAERLGVSQPAISAAMKALEAEIGHKLFEPASRGRRNQPTAKAFLYYDQAVDILRRLENAKATLSADEGRPAKARIGVLRTVSAHHVGAMIESILLAAPHIRWRFLEGNANQLASWLRKDRVDGIWSIVDDVSANSRILWREPYVALVSRTHRLAQVSRSRTSFRDLEGERLVLRGACEMPSGRVAAAGLSLPTVARAECDSLAMSLVAKGVGIAVGPQSFETSDVKAIAVDELNEWRSIGLRWKPDLSPDIVQALTEAIGAA